MPLLPRWVALVLQRHPRSRPQSPAEPRMHARMFLPYPSCPRCAPWHSFSAQAPPGLLRMRSGWPRPLPLDDTKGDRAGTPKDTIAEIKPKRLADLDAIPARARWLQLQGPRRGAGDGHTERGAAPEPKVWHFRGLDCAPPCACRSVAVTGGAGWTRAARARATALRHTGPGMTPRNL